MSDVVVSVVESETNVVVSEQDVAVDVTENVVQVSVSTAGIQGVPGANNDPTYVTVRNATGATLAKGTIVYISGANGNNVQVTPAIATSDATSARTLGWLAVSIPNNGSGLCMVEGYLEGLNTQGFNAGDQLYLSGTTAGAFTATKPQAPIHLVYVGVVTKVSAGDGHVFVKVQNGYELGELHDVQIVSPTNNQVLAYDSATQLWKNAVNAPDGVTSITATAPLTGGTITSTGSIGLNQSLLSITKSQVSDFTSGTVTSASTAQQAGTAVYAVNSGTAVYATTSGTATYSTNSGTAVYATTSGTAVTISGDITKSQVSDFTSGTVASASTAQQSGTAVFANTSGTATFATTSGTATFATTSGTAVFATNAGTAVGVSGSAITQSQVVNLVSDLAGKANLAGGNALTGAQTITATAIGQVPLTLTGAAGQTANLLSTAGGARIPAAGNYFIAPGLTSTFVADFNAGSTTTTPVTIAGLSGQTANLLRLAVAGTDVATFTALGGLNNPTAGNISLFQRLGGAPFLGTLSVGTNSASQVGVAVRGAASQSANLFEAQTSAGAVRTYINSIGDMSTGSLGLGYATPYSGVGNSILGILTVGAGNVGIAVRGSSGQTADLLKLQNSTPVDLLSVNGNGGLIVGTQVSGTTAGSGQIRTSSNTGSNYVDTTANDGAGTGPGLTARRARGTVTAPTQVQANDLLFGIFANGWNDAGAFGGNSVAIRMLANQNFTTTALGSSIVFETASDGTTGRAERMRITGSGTLSIGTTAVTGQLGVVSADAARVGLIVRGAASQSANLQEWQSSAGGILARVESTGAAMFGNGNMSVNSVGSIFANTVNTNIGRIGMSEANSGGQLTVTRQTAAATNPGANIGRLYFRDGTNAGTLRLVVRAGAAGAETTILDNIPQ